MLCRVAAYVGAVVILTLALYAISARFMAKPLADSLTADQRKIRKKSATWRGKVTLVAAIVSVLFIGITRPF
jgi:NADH:ubiquinone oxidoreductase subunit 6 (subunit J)